MNPLRSTSPIKEPLSDADEDEEYEEDGEISAPEYEYGISVESDQEDEDGEPEATLLEAESGLYTKSEEQKSERVARLLAEVREFGQEIIDYGELAGIYDFPIDKFQVRLFCLEMEAENCHILAFISARWNFSLDLALIDQKYI